jgi:hypothetical protein
VSDWIHIVVQHQRDDAAVTATPAQALEDVLPQLLPVKVKPSRRAFHLVKLLVLDLRWQRGLIGEQLADVLADYFVARRDATDTLERQTFASLLKAGSVPALRSLSRMLGWSARRSAAQATEVADLRRQLAASVDKNTTLNTEVMRLRGDVQSLNQQIAEAAVCLRDLEQQLQDCRNSATLRLQDVAGQVSGKLAGRVSALLAQADDALALNEPSVRAGQEFIRLIQSEIRELQQWLGAVLTSEQPTA